MKNIAQNLWELQMKALLLLKVMEENTYLHEDKNPYKEMIDSVTDLGKGRKKKSLIKSSYICKIIRVQQRAYNLAIDIKQPGYFDTETTGIESGLDLTLMYRTY